MMIRKTVLLVALCALLPVAGADENRESAESPFGTYTLNGQERFNGDPYVMTVALSLAEEQFRARIDYRNPRRDDTQFRVIFTRELDSNILADLERGNSVRRPFEVEAEIEEAEVILKGHLRVRKLNDGTFRVALQYACGGMTEDGEPVRITGGAVGVQE